MKIKSKGDLWKETDTLRAELDMCEKLLQAERDRLASVAGVLERWASTKIGHNGPENWAEYNALLTKTKTLIGNI